MKSFLGKWSGENSVADFLDSASAMAEPHPEHKPEIIHYALSGKAVLGELSIELCEVGCDVTVRFYKHEGVKYGYCAQCGVHQSILEL